MIGSKDNSLLFAQLQAPAINSIQCIRLLRLYITILFCLNNTFASMWNAFEVFLLLANANVHSIRISHRKPINGIVYVLCHHQIGPTEQLH